MVCRFCEGDAKKLEPDFFGGIKERRMREGGEEGARPLDEGEGGEVSGARKKGGRSKSGKNKEMI